MKAKHIKYNLTILFLVFLNLVGYSQIFGDSTNYYGIPEPGPSSGCAWFDYDMDGDLDLIVLSNQTSFTALYRNEDDYFVDVADSANISHFGDEERNRIISVGDYSHDNHIDISMSGYDKFEILHNTVFQRNSEDAYLFNLHANFGRGTFMDVDNNSWMDIFISREGEKNLFYSYVEGESFDSWQEIENVFDVNGNYNTLIGIWGDYNKDNAIDLFVANGSEQQNFLYKNISLDTIGLIEVSQQVGITGNYNTKGACWGDYDNDLDLDLFILNHGKNQLYRNNYPNESFTEVGENLGLTDSANTSHASWVDYDNDGDLDLYILNSDSNPNILYRNDLNVGGGFVVSGEMAVTAQCYGGSWGDFDRDQDVDFYLAAGDSLGNENNKLFVNHSSTNGNTMITLDLIGFASADYSSLGARVEIISGSLKQLRYVESTTGGGSQNSLPVEIGLGTNTVIDTLKIFWPSTSLEDVYTNIVLDEDFVFTFFETGCPTNYFDFECDVNYYFPFNGNANGTNSEGDNIPGNPIGVTLVPNRYGMDSTAYYFNEVSDQIFINQAEFWLQDQFAVHIVLKPENITSSETSIILEKTDGSNTFLHIAFEDFGTKLCFGLELDESYFELKNVIDPNYFTDGEWHSISCVYDGFFSIIYVDGNRKVSSSYDYGSTSVNDGSSHFYIGSYPGYGSYRGEIDEILICRYLNENLIKDLMSIPEISGYAEGVEYIDTGIVYLFDADADSTSLPIDSTIIKNGYYCIDSVFSGDYKLLCVPLGNDSSYYASVYYPNALTWNDANIVPITEQDNDTIDFSMISKLYLSGNIQGCGEAIEEGSIILTNLDTEEKQSALLNSSGIFRFNHLDPGNYSLLIVPQGAYANIYDTVYYNSKSDSLHADTIFFDRTIDDLNIVLNSNISIIGKLYSGLTPLENGSIKMFDISQDENDTPIRIVNVTDGYFQIDTLCPGQYKLLGISLSEDSLKFYPTYYSGSLNMENADTLTVDGRIEDTLTFKLKSKLYISVYVIGCDSAIASGEVKLWNASTSEIEEDTLKYNGNFRFEYVDPGKYLIKVYPDGNFAFLYDSVFYYPDSIKNSEDTLTVNNSIDSLSIVMISKMYIEGDVYAGQSPLPIGEVQLFKATNSGYEKYRTTQVINGKFRFDTVCPDSYIFKVLPYGTFEDEYVPTYWMETTQIGKAYRGCCNFSVTNIRINLIHKNDNKDYDNPILNFQIFPSPIAAELNIISNCDLDDFYDVTVYNDQGTEIDSGKLYDKLTFNTSSWSSGIYFVQIVSKKLVTVNYKISKK